MSRMHTCAVLAAALCASVLICFLFPVAAPADENIEVIKIAYHDSSALIRTDAETLKVVHVGDNVPPFGKIEMIDKESIVFKNKNLERTILKIANNKQRIQRIEKFDSTRQKPIVISNSGADAADKSAGVGKGAPQGEATEKK